MADDDVTPMPKPGRLRRMGNGIARYGIRRVHGSAITRASRMIIGGYREIGLSAMSPNKLDRDELRSGLAGRYSDGGTQRFLDEIEDQGLSERDLKNVLAGHRRFALTYGVFSFGVLLAGLALMLMAGDIIVILGGGALAIFAFVFAAIAIRSDFAAWQIRVRRFDGFKVYLDNRNEPTPRRPSQSVTITGPVTQALLKD